MKCKICGKSVANIGRLRKHRFEVHGLAWATRGSKKPAPVQSIASVQSNGDQLIATLSKYRNQLTHRIKLLDEFINGIQSK